MRHFKSIIVFVIFCIAAMLSCNSSNNILQQWQNIEKLPGGLQIQFPFDSSLFPQEIAPASVHWQDSTAAKRWFLVISHDKRNILYFAQTKKTRWLPDSSLWEALKQDGVNEPLTVSVLGIQGRNILSGANVTIRISADSVAAPIFYRAVPLPFLHAVKNFDKIRWHLGNISSSQPAPALLENLPLCGNCHTFTSDGHTLAMDVDYANDKGSYVISDVENETVLTPDKIITWSSYRPQDGKQTYGLLSQISPDGRYVASTVKDRSIFVATEGLFYSQLFFPIKGIIAIHDRTTGEYFALHGADDPEYVQSNPAWSPDGQYLYFCRERAYTSEAIEQTNEVLLPTELAQEFIDGQRDFKYDIYRVPFNNGRGGVAEPLPGASNNGKSNFFPRVSPNGRWLVYTQAENFMLLQPDSKLYILPADGGEPRSLECNTNSMNSWHTWSPNSKWLVFSSKLRGPYTDLLLTHIDDAGTSSPPVLLEHLAFDNYAINIPEFVNIGRRSWEKIVDEFSQQAHYYFTMARSYVGKQKIGQAMQALEKAISLDPTYARSYVFKGHIEFANDMYDRALISYEKAAQYDKRDAELYVNLGTTRYKLGKYKKAIQAFDHAEAINANPFDVFIGRALAYAKLDHLRRAIDELTRALEINSQSAIAYYERGICYSLLDDLENAIKDLQRVTRLEPSNERAYEKLGACYYQLHRYQKAMQSFTSAIVLQPEQYKLYQSRGDCEFRMKNLQAALDDYAMAINLQPRSGTSYYRRGVVFIQLGDKQAGCNDLLMAQQLGIREAQEMLAAHCKN